MKPILLSLTIAFLIPIFSYGQNVTLANHYLNRGEYEKALGIYETLYEKYKSDFYFTKLAEALRKMERYEQAEKLINERIKEKPDALDAYVLLGQIENLQGNLEASEKSYLKAIENLKADRVQIIRVANAFSEIGLYEKTIQVLEKGAELLNNKYIFAYNLAEYCRRAGQKDKMVKYYLLSLEHNPSRLNSIKVLMERFLDEDDLAVVQKEIYKCISAGDASPVFSELLAWVAIQREDYMAAFRQMRALDIRQEEDGRRVYRIGNIARHAEDYNTAIQAFNYIINNKSENSSFYISALMALLNTQVEKLSSVEQSSIGLLKIDAVYDSLLTRLGENQRTVHLMLDQAQFNAFQLGNLEKAISILERIIAMKTVNPRIRAKAKLQLGDFLLIRGQRWDATLLYSQVEKRFPEEDLGESARFKNAMLSYYTGDFQWAKEQFDILKSATSRLLSNDAIDMSVFIADNLNLDTTSVPLIMYAGAEFLLFQNKHNTALKKLDSLEIEYPDHALKDDIHYLKGEIYSALEKYDAAIQEYTMVFTETPDEIRADNAIYKLALLYDEVLDNKSEAIKLYEKLFLNYQGSTLAVYARKRYRELKGESTVQ